MLGYILLLPSDEHKFREPHPLNSPLLGKERGENKKGGAVAPPFTYGNN
jgi:hypothetical protein